MKVEIFEENTEILPEYEKISIAFQVESYFRVELCESGLGGIKLFEEKAATPYVKDYDNIQNEKPSHWIKRWDISNWGILSAFINKQRVGGAAIAWKTPEVDMLEGREDLACLWDLRVHSNYRNKGCEHQLFVRSLAWSRERGCRRFKVETQNINVPACRFYARQGCELGTINRYAYPEIMNETQLIWYRNV
jgi:ribosomal protein S18 acetylase RimI-like enzyme